MAKVVIVGYDKMLYSLIDGALQKGHTVLGVFRVDRIRYSKPQLFFKDIFNPSIDFTNIKSKKLYDIKAQSVNDKNFLKEIKKLKPDLILVGSWGEKFKKEILDFVPCVNFHPALLPKNRGANPYFWSIFLNQKVTGLTVHFMNEKFDRGDILLQEAITIDERETGKSLKDKTTRLAKAMVGELLDLFDKKQLQPIKQDEKFASYEPQLSEKEIVIDLNQDVAFVSRHLRALYPWVKPYVKIKNRYIKFSDYEILELPLDFSNQPVGCIVQKDSTGITLKGSDFLLKIYK